MFSEWSFVYFIIQLVAGFLGAQLAALVAHEYRFGFIGHSAAGLIAGALSGIFLQRIVMTTVTITGDAIPILPLQADFYQAMTGLAAGAMTTLAVGFVRSEMGKSE